MDSAPTAPEPLTELLTAAIAAGAALSGAWIVGRQARLQSRDRLVHERILAAEARRQDRIEPAYIQLLTAVNEAVRLIETDAGDREHHDYEACQARLDTVWVELDAFGTPIMRERFNTWRADWMLFKIDIHNERVRGDRRDRELETTRRDALETAEALRQQIRAELAGE